MKLSLSPSLSHPALCIFLLIPIISGCNELQNPYPQQANRGVYSGGYNQRDDYYYRERERRELEEERRELERERRRFEREKNRSNIEGKHTPPPLPPKVKPEDQCPRGFKPTDRKCTDKERKKGCRDTRTPSGLRCIDLP